MSKMFEIWELLHTPMGVMAEEGIMSEANVHLLQGTAVIIATILVYKIVVGMMYNRKSAYIALFSFLAVSEIYEIASIVTFGPLWLDVILVFVIPITCIHFMLGI